MTPNALLYSEPLCSQIMIRGTELSRELTREGARLAGRPASYVTLPTYISALTCGAAETTLASIVSFAASFFDCNPTAIERSQLSAQYAADCRETVKAIVTQIMGRGLEPMQFPNDIGQFSRRWRANRIELHDGDYTKRDYKNFLATLIKEAAEAILKTSGNDTLRLALLNQTQLAKETVAMMAQLEEVKIASKQLKCPTTPAFGRRFQNISQTCRRWLQLTNQQKQSLDDRINNNRNISFDAATTTVYSMLVELRDELINKTLMRDETIEYNQDGSFTRNDDDLTIKAMRVLSTD